MSYTSIHILVPFQVRPEEHSDTEYILVDPSCSGSGIANRLNYDSVRSAVVALLRYRYDY